jgi:hypothetical protein
MLPVAISPITPAIRAGAARRVPIPLENDASSALENADYKM